MSASRDSDGKGAIVMIMLAIMACMLIYERFLKRAEAPPAPSWAPGLIAASATWQDVPMANGPQLKRVPMGAGWLVYAPGSHGGLTWAPDVAPVASSER